MTESKRKKRIERNMRHVIERAFERFGVALSEEDITNAEQSIINGDCVKVDEFGTRRRAAYLIEIQGIKAVWIYDNRNRNIVTVLSISMYGQGAYKKFKKERKKRISEYKKHERRVSTRTGNRDRRWN